MRMENKMHEIEKWKIKQVNVLCLSLIYIDYKLFQPQLPPVWLLYIQVNENSSNVEKRKTARDVLFLYRKKHM